MATSYIEFGTAQRAEVCKGYFRYKNISQPLFSLTGLQLTGVRATDSLHRGLDIPSSDYEDDDSHPAF